MKVILLSGKAEHGKTTAAEQIVNKLKNAKIVPLAKKMKEQAMMIGWDGKKDEKGRKLLQEISWPIKHYHGVDIYAKWCYEQALGLDYLIVDDCRMMAEVDYFKKLLSENTIDDLKIIRIVRPNYTSSLTPEQLKDVSETELDNYNFDYYVINDETPEELGLKMLDIIKKGS